MEEEEKKEELPGNTETEQIENIEDLKKELSESKNKYLRLYADFENYKRFVTKEKEEILTYCNEDIIREILTVIDHLEMAIQHSSDNNASMALVEGVELTLKEMKTTLEKFGLVGIEALGKSFDPLVHHAIAQVESEENEENMVVRELRKGYMFKDRVLRAALVEVSKKPSQQVQTIEIKEEE